jgi:thymidylate synthase
LFRQFEHLVKEIKENPHLSTHKISPWLPHYCLQHSELQRKVVVAPCHGDIQVTVLGDNLNLTMNQRSGDYPVGVPADIMMYAALTIMLAHVTGLKPHRLIHRVTDGHLYENQIPYVKMMIERPSFPFPTLHLTNEGERVTDIFDFRTRHFELRDYEYSPAIPEMPVTE